MCVFLFGYYNFKISVALTDAVDHLLFLGRIFERYVVCKTKHTAHIGGFDFDQLVFLRVLGKDIVERARIVKILGNGDFYGFVDLLAPCIACHGIVDQEHHAHDIQPPAKRFLPHLP